MIIVWGSIEARAEQFDEVLRLCLEHVHRSRSEPGCISHSVQVDAENPHRLVFFEEWRDMSSLQTHFKVPESELFIKSVSQLTAGAPAMKIYDATPAN
jgi:quinol monooxygenase YgiN